MKKPNKLMSKASGRAMLDHFGIHTSSCLGKGRVQLENAVDLDVVSSSL